MDSYFAAHIPGVIPGSLLVFIPAVGEFVIPALLGGPDQLMIGKVLWTEFFATGIGRWRRLLGPCCCWPSDSADYLCPLSRWAG
ncbi:MAG: hypothetical protein CM15mP46_3630 [Alphaproteobacteria bacterium]|nr:MAG: hypothetical protein CM15mP46_3630 [Alphaproteobacteria bacterium]